MPNVRSNRFANNPKFIQKQNIQDPQELDDEEEENMMFEVDEPSAFHKRKRELYESKEEMNTELRESRELMTNILRTNNNNNNNNNTTNIHPYNTIFCSVPKKNNKFRLKNNTNDDNFFCATKYNGYSFVRNNNDNNTTSNTTTTTNNNNNNNNNNNTKFVKLNSLYFGWITAAFSYI